MLDKLPLLDDVMLLVLAQASVAPQEDALTFGPVSRQFNINMHRLWERRFHQRFPNSIPTSSNWPREFDEAQKQENPKLTPEQIRLFYLLHTGNLAAFLKRNPSLDQFYVRDCHGNSLLDLAYMKGYQVILEYCFEKATEYFLNPDCRIDNNLNRILHWTAYCGKTHLLSSLISPTMPVNAINGRSETALRIASRRGHLDMVIELLRLGADPTRELADSVTPLHFAVDKGHLAIVRALLPQPVTAEALAMVNRVPHVMNQDTALVRAVKNHNEAIVKELVVYGANVNQPVQSGSSALHIAASQGDDGILRILLTAPDVAVNQTEIYQKTPLHRAAEKGHFRCVNLLLSKMGVEIDCVDYYQATPLTHASNSGDLRSVQILLRNGAKPNHIAINNFTPLLYALHRGHCDVVQELIDRGADVNLVLTEISLTTLMFAMQNFDAIDIRALEIILNAKDFDAKQEHEYYGKNLLHYAAYFGDANIVRLLLDKGVDKDHKDKSGKTPGDIALKEGNEEIIALLCESKQLKI